MAENQLQQRRVIRDRRGTGAASSGMRAKAEVIEDLVHLVHDVVAGVGPGERLARKGELPAHEQHQAEAEEEERKAGAQILDADGLVVGGENVGADKAELVMLVAVIVVRGHGRGTAWRWAGAACGFGAGWKIVHRLVTGWRYNYTFSRGAQRFLLEMKVLEVLRRR